MRIAIANQVFGKAQVIDANFVPQVGYHVDLWYKPLPIVKQVIAFPSKETTDAMGIEEHIDAVLLVE